VLQSLLLRLSLARATSRNLRFFVQVVFGEVAEGMNVVKAVEALGSSSGRTKKTVTITECGQLA